MVAAARSTSARWNLGGDRLLVKAFTPLRV
jgi:hypothetical protein